MTHSPQAFRKATNANEPSRGSALWQPALMGVRFLLGRQHIHHPCSVHPDAPRRGKEAVVVRGPSEHYARRAKCSVRRTEHEVKRASRTDSVKAYLTSSG
jgi:hypothetical protein